MADAKASPSASSADNSSEAPPAGNCGAGIWVNATNGEVPLGAIVSGKDINGESLYVARANHEGGLIPGKLVPSLRGAYIPWGGKEYFKTQYQVLTGGPNHWIPIHGNNVPPGAFHGGDTEGGEPLFIGRVHHEGSITPGKVQQSLGVCFISFTGKELSFSDYELLMA